MYIEKHPLKLTLYIFIKTKFTTFLRLAAKSLFYFLQNAIYFEILSVAML